jgi:hypothetical protein
MPRNGNGNMGNAPGWAEWDRLHSRDGILAAAAGGIKSAAAGIATELATEAAGAIKRAAIGPDEDED